jgi:hypothetical protein
MNELEKIKKDVAFIRYYALGITILFLFFLFSGFRKQQDHFNIIRAKGIIIEDSSGRDRILLGAPVPASAYRVRTDTKAVRKHWAGSFPNPDQYMKWYKDYYHGAIGMIVLNEEGFDRITLGYKLPDPNIGKRMFEASGLMWNDRHGWERGGAGVNTSETGESRSVVGVDDKDGEAVHIVALEDGTKGVMVGGKPGSIMLGMSKNNEEAGNIKNVFAGMRFMNPEGKIKWEQQLNKE